MGDYTTWKPEPDRLIVNEETSESPISTPMDALMELNQINDQLENLLSKRHNIMARFNDMKEAEAAYYQQVFNSYEKIVTGLL